MRHPALILIVMMLILGIPSMVRSQSIGSLTGRVLDESGSSLPGASIEVRVPGKTSIHYANANGQYSFLSLSVGSYEVVFKLYNFSTVLKTLSIEAGRTTEMNVTLIPSLNAQIVVTGKKTFTNLADIGDSANDLTGIADTANQGVVSGKQLEARPFLRAGEVLETVPGVIISQHSGEGKANQYYLRGFNLDHGTDLGIWVNDVPANFPTHAHGQGYADLNFLIPELISAVQYEKGPYSAEDGDFSAVGSMRISYMSFLDHTIAQGSGGNDGYGRGLFASSFQAGGGHFLYALEVLHNDGPWQNPDDYRKYNGILRYTRGNQQNAFSVTGMGYNGEWNSTDQVPDRAISEGLIGRFGAIDPTDGGKTHRYSLSADFQHSWTNSVTQATAYVVGYKLNLFSDFTYFLDDPIHGDQFEQADDRVTSGFRINHQIVHGLFGLDSESRFGVDFRNDDIGNVGLYHTEARVRLSTIRQDDVVQRSAGLYYENRTQWMQKLRTILGIREDVYHFDVTSSIPENSGQDSASLASPKVNVIFGPWQQTEYYANFGYGFHSNDARGSTITVDPSTLLPMPKVDPLVRAKGTEVGIRSTRIRGLQTTVSLWLLDLDSELLFVGDAGTTEPSRPSRRTGIEWTNYYKMSNWFTLSANLAFSKARFTDSDPAGDRIPGAPDAVISTEGIFDNLHHFFGALGVRYFGARPLIEDNSVRSKSSTLVNARIGYRLQKQWNLSLDVFNLLNSESSDIDYFYTSRLPGEPLAGIDDIHTHPVESRAARISISKDF